ncbi:MAG: hypothetical protein A2Z83_03540 [Omnitrophica bacterium GWA2_52_8]|nr:MAG: hypothetical protein A2Z83_03540 [Omnitrophica bacterium GWA2_52_8]
MAARLSLRLIPACSRQAPLAENTCGNGEGFISPRTFPCRFNEKPAGNEKQRHQMVGPFFGITLEIKAFRGDNNPPWTSIRQGLQVITRISLSPMRNALEEAVAQMGFSICTPGVVFCALLKRGRKTLNAIPCVQSGFSHRFV